MRDVYNGYEELFMTGEEIKEHFKNAYERFGKHHELISSCKMNFEKYYKKIQDDKTYRVFLNNNFCKIMDAKTDCNLYFFGYTKEKPKWAKD